MKRMLIGAAAGLSIVIGVYAFSRPSHTIPIADTLPTNDTFTTYSVAENIDSLVIDTTGLFDLVAIRQRKYTEESLLQAIQLVRKSRGMDDNPDRQKVLEQAVRVFPGSETYRWLGWSINRQSPGAVRLSERLVAMVDSLKWPSDYYISAARYALGKSDTDAAVELLNWAMTQDSLAALRIASDSFFFRLDMYEPFYTSMDRHLSGTNGQAGTLRTISSSTTAALPFTLTLALLFQKHTSIPVSGSAAVAYSASDAAMRDLVRGSRDQRFSRSVDRSVTFVAALHLSDSFSSYIYADREEVNEIGMWDWDLFDAPANFILINIDKAGHKLGEQKIGCSCSPIHITTAMVDSSGLITSRDLKQIWQKNPLSAGYKGNKVVDRKVLSTHYYQIEHDGRISESSLPVEQPEPYQVQ